MKPNRRDFIRILLASSIAESVDVEKLLWIPKPIITVPSFSLSDIIALELERITPKIRTLFERDDIFYSILDKKNTPRISSRELRIPLIIEPGKIRNQ